MSIMSRVSKGRNGCRRSRRNLLLAGVLASVLAGWARAADLLLPPLEGTVGNSRPAGDQVGFSDEYPAHAAATESFFLAATEVTKAQWDAVRTWGLEHGYPDLPEGSGGTAADPAHPVVDVSWHDAAKWCNARAEKEGLAPAYRLDAVSLAPYRTGEVDGIYVLWHAAGYRLPTESEWELAARGGLAGQDFPWAGSSVFYYENISSSHANYLADGTRPPGQFAANGYGLFDMAGNVAEWCGDWYADDAYETPAPNGPEQPAVEHLKVVRGGSWRSQAADLRVSARGMAKPETRQDHVGFRTARTLAPTSLFGSIDRFTATEENGKVVLRWWVSTLEDIVGFRVSRLENGTWTPVHEGLIPYTGTEAYALIDAAALPGQEHRYAIELVATHHVLETGPFERTATPLRFVSPAVPLPGGGVELRWESRPDEQYQVVRSTNLLHRDFREVLPMASAADNLLVDPDPPPTAFYWIEMRGPPAPSPEK